MSVYTSRSERIDYAVRTITKGGPYTRTFDTCFEMNDGDAVIHAILRRSLRNAKLRAALEKNHGLLFDSIKQSDRERYGAAAIYPEVTP